MNPNILIIDDDVMFQHNLGETLQSLGYAVETAGKGIDGFWKAYRTKPDLIILDVMLPEIDGWEICQRLREKTNLNAPILFLTALGGEEDMVKGLEIGGDDYLVKPVSMRVLEARVKALLRRTYKRSNSITSHTIEYKGLVIDFVKYEVKRNDQRIDLTPTEFKLLGFLAKNKGRILGHNFLLREIWGEDCIGQINNLRLYIMDPAI